MYNNKFQFVIPRRSAKASNKSACTLKPSVSAKWLTLNTWCSSSYFCKAPREYKNNLLCSKCEGLAFKEFNAIAKEKESVSGRGNLCELRYFIMHSHLEYGNGVFLSTRDLAPGFLESNESCWIFGWLRWDPPFSLNRRTMWELLSPFFSVAGNRCQMLFSCIPCLLLSC